MGRKKKRMKLALKQAARSSAPVAEVVKTPPVVAPPTPVVEAPKKSVPGPAKNAPAKKAVLKSVAKRTTKPAKKD